MAFTSLTSGVPRRERNMTTTTIYLHSHTHRWNCISVKKKEKNDRSNYTTMIYKIIKSN